MKQLLPACLLALLVAQVASADALPPLPKGYKSVTVKCEVVISKDMTGYVFFLHSRTFPGGGSFNKIDLPTDKATAMPAPARRTALELVAVPKDAAKEFKTDEELSAAVQSNKVKGTGRLALPGTATVADSVKDATVKWTYTITGVDEKGFKTKVEGDGYDKQLEKGKGREPSPVSLWMAGGALALALTFGGLWLTGRARRKP